MTRNAEAAITALLTRYCTLLDSGRLDEIAGTIFTEDLEESHGVGMATSHGREQLTNWFKAICADWEGSAHFITNVDIEVNGTTARSRCYFQAWHWFKSDEDRPSDRDVDLVTLGVYLDELRLTEVGWRIASRRRRNIGSSAIGMGKLPDAFQGLGGS